MRLAYQVITKEETFEIPAIKHSRFIAKAIPVKTKEDISIQLNLVKGAYHDARHCCYAYRLKQNNLTQAFDDGEPKNSAGKPILAPILGTDLFDIIVIVIRYFGGVKLGVGGLVKAYGEASSSVIQRVNTRLVSPKTLIVFSYDYNKTQAVNSVLFDFGLKPTVSDYQANVSLSLEIDDAKVSDFEKLLIEKTANQVFFIRKEQI